MLVMTTIVFDLDGTLVAGFTGVIMTQDRLRRRQMSAGEFIGMVQAGLNHQLGRSEFEDLIGKGARMLRGNSVDDVDELAERLFVQKVVGRIYPEMRELVRAHMARGHTVVLSSSALTVQVEPVARFLGINNVLSNKFETDDDGLITGEVQRPIIWGPGKARAVQEFAAANGVDLSKSYFYADGDEDVAGVNTIARLGCGHDAGLADDRDDRAACQGARVRVAQRTPHVRRVGAHGDLLHVQARDLLAHALHRRTLFELLPRLLREVARHRGDQREHR